MTLHHQHPKILQIIAHEVGHAFFAKMHEHQRPDAGTHITFNCESLSDYKTMVQKFEKPHEPHGYEKGYVEKELCHNPWRASATGFSAGNFAPYPTVAEADAMTIPEQSLRISNFQGDLDFSSIMMYSSDAGAVGGRRTLLRRVPVKVGPKSTNLIVTKATPSKGDCKSIHDTYHATS
ncbi:hypothetical protein MMC09_003401 [Bachmanniomyces sp. S44760]|nr:hypothetical protein [Bachmanniomyces sp. S44760]